MPEIPDPLLTTERGSFTLTGQLRRDRLPPQSER